MENKLKLIPVISIILIIIVPIIGYQATNFIRAEELQESKNAISITDLKFIKEIKNYGYGFSSTYYVVTGFFKSTKQFSSSDLSGEVAFYDENNINLGTDSINIFYKDIHSNEQYQILTNQTAGGKAVKAKFTIKKKNKHELNKEDIIFEQELPVQIMQTSS
ncbi:MAG: hypothetical protein LBC39_05665 [Methanobrevibacter sp.]|jgi:hypothetical protein|nr:hypothetical protein [Candidatus Methanovirga aequatorialis]